MRSLLLTVLVLTSALSGCKYYGSALPPEYPMSMDDATQIAHDRGPSSSTGMDRNFIKKPVRPRIDRPSYIPEKEMALVAPPRTLLVWTYPHITEDNTRVFGNWSTIFLTERYEWVKPSTEQPIEEYIPVGNGG